MPVNLPLDAMLKCDCVPAEAGFLCTCQCGQVIRSDKPDVFHVCQVGIRQASSRLSAAAQKDALKRTDAPSFLQKAKNFAIATAQHVAAGMPMASDEEIIRRHDICMACEFFKDNSCSKCGCPVYRDKKFISKLAWADQSCPVGKW